MDLETLHTIGMGITDLLKLKTMPIGCSFFKTLKDIPQGYFVPDKKKVVCNMYV